MNPDNTIQKSLGGKAILVVLILIFAVAGIVDAGYLTHKYYTGEAVACAQFGGCDLVLDSNYAAINGVPLALFGLIYYSITSIIALIILFTRKLNIFPYLFIISVLAFIVSLFLVFLQFFVIHHICIYCLGSATLSTAIFVCSLFVNRRLNAKNS